MNLKVAFFLLLVSGIYGCSTTSKIKRASKALEKEKIEKAETLLYKAIAKDSSHTGVHYAFSELFIDTAYEDYNIDSAYLHINTAVDNYEKLAEDSKSLKKLKKLAINDSTLQLQKAEIEALAFQHVKKTNTIPAYNYFLDNYATASQVTEARLIRNELAFEKAKETGTYAAYKKFIDTYPNAIQIKEASELYEFLLYENKTKTRRLDSYVSFLKEFPNTNYTLDALENIFELYTINNTPGSYINFIQDFPQNAFSKKASDYLYHIIKDKNGIRFFERQYPGLISDSLKQVIEVDTSTLFPVYDNGLYGFKNNIGEMVIAPKFSTIEEDYLCGELPDNYLIATAAGSSQIFNHLGNAIYENDYHNIYPLADGLLLVQQDGKYGMLHLSGNIIAQPEFDSLSTLDHRYIKYRQNNKWGLLSYTGRRITDPLYDDIFVLGEFILFQKYEKLAIANQQLLFALANQETEELPFLYDDVILLNKQTILGIDGKEQVLLDQALKIIIPKEEHEIYSLNNEGWLIKKDSRFKVFTEELVSLGNTSFDSANYNATWLSLKKEDKWALINLKENTFPDFKYDSLVLLGKHFVLASKEGEQHIIFNHFQEIPLSKSETYQILSPQATQTTSYREYLLIKNPNNYKTLYNIKGEQVLAGQYDQIDLVGEDLIVLEKRAKKGLADSTGNILLPISYDGIGNYNDGHVSTLKNQKFGLFNAQRNINIPAEYDVMLRPFDDSLFIAKKKQFGLIDHNNKALLPFQFDEITYWNDTLALVKSNDFWHVYHIPSQKPLLEAISSIKYVIDEKENKQAIILKDNNYGVLSTNKDLLLLSPVYDDILNLGGNGSPIYFAEKRVKEADLYVVIYYNQLGEIIHKQTFNEEDYDFIYCY